MVSILTTRDTIQHFQIDVNTFSIFVRAFPKSCDVILRSVVCDEESRLSLIETLRRAQGDTLESGFGKALQFLSIKNFTGFGDLLFEQTI